MAYIHSGKKITTMAYIITVCAVAVAVVGLLFHRIKTMTSEVNGKKEILISCRHETAKNTETIKI